MKKIFASNSSLFQGWLLCLVTLLLTIALNFALRRTFGYDVFSVTFWFVIPVGAVLLAFCAVSGFAFVAARSGRKANWLDLVFLMGVCLALQILVVAADYISLRLSGVIPPGAEVTFYDYFLCSITATEYVTYSRQFGATASAPVGDAGWFILLPRVACLLAIAKVTHTKFAGNSGYAPARSYGASLTNLGATEKSPDAATGGRARCVGNQECPTENISTQSLRNPFMYLISNGMVAVGITKCPGKIVLTERAVFILKETVNAGPAAALFGIFGALVAVWGGRVGSGKAGPAFLLDPDLKGLSERDRRGLFGTEKIVKYELSQALAIKSTRMGFSFNDGVTRGRYEGFLNKKKIAAFLQSQGIAIDF